MKDKNDILTRFINALKNQSAPADPPQELIDDTLQKLSDAGTEAHKRILGNVLLAMEKSERQNLADVKPNIGRIIMRNRITKLAVAAAIIIAVLVGINQFGATTGKGGVAWAQVIETAEMIPALTAEMTAEIIFSENKKLVTKSDLYIAGDYGTRVDIYMNGELWMIKYRLPNEKVAYVITPKKKQYMRIDLSDAEAGVGHDRDDPRQWLKKILSGDYVELGPANINGVDVEGIESNNPEVTGSESMTMRLWVAVETNLPVRIEIKGEDMEGGQMRPQKFVVDDFEWNAELDPSIFEPDIPDDYELIEPQKPPKTQ